MTAEPESVERSRERIEREVKAYLLREFLPDEDPSALSSGTPLVSSGVLDSISIVRLVSHLESTYGIEMEAHEFGADYLDTPAMIADTVVGKLR